MSDYSHQQHGVPPTATWVHPETPPSGPFGAGTGPLVRSADGKIAGVCGGLAAWLGIDPTAVRLLWLAGTFCTAVFPGIVLYILLWTLMPGPYERAQSSGRLALSQANVMIGGVCGGIADWLGWSPTSVRTLYVILSICSAAFPGTIVYIVLWIVMPRPWEVSSHSSPTP